MILKIGKYEVQLTKGKVISKKRHLKQNAAQSYRVNTLICVKE